MYKGNMTEFVENLSLYMKANYGKEFFLSKIDFLNFKDGKYTQSPSMVLFETKKDRDFGWRVYDREDFEQQVYDIINRNMHIMKDWEASRSRSSVPPK